MLPARALVHGDVYVRRAGSREPVPPGWATHALGSVGGVCMEFAYRPDRHDVCRALNPLSQKVVAGLARAGYRKAASFDGGGELWVRDRAAAAYAKYQRISVKSAQRLLVSGW